MNKINIFLTNIGKENKFQKNRFSSKGLKGMELLEKSDEKQRTAQQFWGCLK